MLTSKFTIRFNVAEVRKQSINGRAIFGQEMITFDQLLFFAGATSLTLEDTIITHENGSSVQIETIVANFPNVKECWFTVNPDSSNISINTVKELLKIPNFLRMTKFILENVSDTFDIETFYRYLKERDNLCCAMVFRSIISDEYFAGLEMIVDELLELPEPTSFKFPFFVIPNLDLDKKLKLTRRFFRHVT